GIERELSEITDAAGDGELNARRADARAGKFACVDRVTRHHVEPRLGGGGAEARREALVQVEARVAQRGEQVLFHRNGMEIVRRLLVEEAEVRVRLDEPGHERGAGA